jgi:two-component system NtrC family response regulator
MRLSPAAIEMLAEYTWPGDVAELRSTLSTMIESTKGTEIETGQIPQTIRMAVMAQRGSRLPVEKIKLDDFLAEIERELINRALAQTKFNRSQAARQLGLNRARLLRRCESLGITLPTEQPEFEPIDFEESTE